MLCIYIEDWFIDIGTSIDISKQKPVTEKISHQELEIVLNTKLETISTTATKASDHSLVNICCGFEFLHVVRRNHTLKCINIIIQ